MSNARKHHIFKSKFIEISCDHEINVYSILFSFGNPKKILFLNLRKRFIRIWIIQRYSWNSFQTGDTWCCESKVQLLVRFKQLDRARTYLRWLLLLFFAMLHTKTYKKYQLGRSSIYDLSKNICPTTWRKALFCDDCSRFLSNASHQEYRLADLLSMTYPTIFAQPPGETSHDYTLCFSTAAATAPPSASHPRRPRPDGAASRGWERRRRRRRAADLCGGHGGRGRQRRPWPRKGFRVVLGVALTKW